MEDDLNYEINNLLLLSRKELVKNLIKYFPLCKKSSFR